MSYIPFIWLGHLDQGGLDRPKMVYKRWQKSFFACYICHFNYDHVGNIYVCSFNSTDTLSSFEAFFWQIFTILGVLSEEVWNMPPPRGLWHYPKDLIPPWGTLDLLTAACESLVKDLTLKVVLGIEPFSVAFTSCEVATLCSGHHLDGVFWRYLH